MYIPYGRQTIDEKDIEAVVETLSSDLITTGPKIRQFEEKVAAYTGASYAVAVSSGTAALHAACYAAGIGPGDEVITTPITFAATSNSVLYCGGRPVFADIRPDTWNLDPEDVERRITKKTKAIIPVHFTGQPCDMDAIHGIARRHGLLVLEDAAHALGAEYKGKKIGSLSELTVFSFHPVKPITTGEGGLIVTNDRRLYEKLLLFRGHCITRDEAQMVSEKEGDWYYQQLDLGYNYRITDIQGALGISQMNKLDGFIRRRRFLAERYQKAFEGMEGLKRPVIAEACSSSWHLYALEAVGRDRKEVFNRLRDSGIGVNVHYIPVYRHPYYQSHGYQEVRCPQAELYYSRAITLPLFPLLTEREQDYVIQKVREVLS